MQDNTGNRQKNKDLSCRHLRQLRIMLYGVVLFFGVLTLSGCSTKKNTKGTRFYQALTTRYNVYFNGNEAYKAGCLALDQGNKDNYMDLIPLYPIGNPSSVGIGSGDFDRAIEKSQKAITLHSIKRKPQRKPGKRYSDSYKEWLKRREFNPFLYHAWLLLGKAQFQKGDFPEAAATFSYVARLYSTQPEIAAEARIWLARCYTESEWYYDAEEVLQKVNNDSLPTKLVPDYSTAYGNYLLGSERFREAIPYLLTTIKNEKNKLQRAREYYLLGQVYQLLGEPGNAFAAYGKVIRQNPPYELELNARIRQTEVAVYNTGRQTAAMKKITDKLNRMAKQDKNKDYLDQVYYALGNIYMTAGDTVQAIKAYQLGVDKSTRGGIEKGVLQLTLGNLFWEMGRYGEAQVAYTDAIGLLDNQHEEYKGITRRSEILDELVPHVEAIELQDSLQHLASLDEASRMIVIDTLIARFIQKEEAEAKAQREAERDQERNELIAQNASNRPQSSTTTPTVSTGDNSWYFYNRQVMAQGKTDFQRQWGNRKLEDNWRRKNKTVVSLDDFEEVNYDEPETGEVDAEEIVPGTDTTPSDTAGNAETEAIDEKNPLFYLQQIPLTPEAMDASNGILSEALFNAGMIYKDKVEDYPRAERTFIRLFDKFPDYATLDEAYYNYYLLMGRLGRMAEAERIKAILAQLYPESKYSLIVNDPEFAYISVHGKRLEDSLYAATYRAYQNGNLNEVIANGELSARRYPMGTHRPKFIFLEAVAALQQGDQKLFLSELKTLVQNYPENEITDLAAHILKGIQEGRLLASGAMSFGNIWGRRSGEGGEEEEMAVVDSLNSFSAERNTPYLFILAYEDGKINENQLLYEMARYNFASFLVKNFDLDIERDRGIGRFIVSDFNNLDEALYYRRQLYSNPQMNEKLSGLRALVISKENYDLMNRYFSFDDYDKFFEETFGEAGSHPLIEGIEIDGSTLDDPIMNLPERDEDDWEDSENEDDVIDEEDAGNYYIF